MTLRELAFPAMGTSVRLLGSPGAPLAAARALVEDLEGRLTRFDPGSELCRLNGDPRETVPASPELRAAVAAALDGAAATGGLADPTLLGALVEAGYDRSLTGRPRAELQEALASAPPIRAAAAAPGAAWRLVRVGEDSITRPPGLRLDLGGSAKGHAADLAAAMLARYGPCAADLGGDLRVHGAHEVQVMHPLTGHPAATLALHDDAVATSGIDRRLWWDDGGRPAHHLLDPATNRPAWTGVITATAKAPTAALAEALAKAAVLAGPEILAAYGGVLTTYDGTVRKLPAGEAASAPDTVGRPRKVRAEAVVS
jgi:thiamine biosynthesis lipoprotein